MAPLPCRKYLSCFDRMESIAALLRLTIIAVDPLLLSSITSWKRSKSVKNRTSMTKRTQRMSRRQSDEGIPISCRIRHLATARGRSTERRTPQHHGRTATIIVTMAALLDDINVTESAGLEPGPDSVSLPRGTATVRTSGHCGLIGLTAPWTVRTTEHPLLRMSCNAARSELSDYVVTGVN